MKLLIMKNYLSSLHFLYFRYIKYSKHTALEYINPYYSPRVTKLHNYTGCHRRKGPNFGRVFLMLNYTDITQNTCIQS